MFNREYFKERDEARLFQCMQQHSFATLVSPGDCGLSVSHLPLLPDRDGRRIVGHMARANDHWERAADRPAVAIFHGPHAYISPAWYQASNVVPTWNYVVVHAHGTLRILESDDARIDVLRRYVNTYESSRPQPWSLADQDTAFIRQLSRQTVAFEIPIQRLEGKWKLSQNHSPERRDRVAAALMARNSDDDRAIAELMRASLEQGKS